MKRVWRFCSKASRAKLSVFEFHFDGFSKHRTVPSFTTALSCRNYNTVSNSNKISDLIPLFTPFSKEDLFNKVTVLKNELVRESSDSVRVYGILDDNSDYLNHRYPEGSVLLELMRQLDSMPSLALQVFDWRRMRSNVENPMDMYEYSKAIRAAGRAKNIDLAVKFFKEAAVKGIKTTSTYNALMSAFMANGHTDSCQSLFCDLKRDPTCDPSIATYNILICVFGNLMLVDHMEAAFREIEKLDLAPDISTYNHLISGYIIAFMWEDMEKVFQMLKSGPVEPNTKTYLLMLRGYANSGNLEKMEEMYSFVRDHVNKNEFSSIRCMIRAYCKGSKPDRLEKIDALLKFIPEKEYSPWLNVLLIELYAKEDWLEKMENAINEAFEHGTSVTTKGIMRCIISTYFRCNAVEKLENFVRRAEISEWNICRSLYHCKMAMYGSQKSFNEMHNVLEEMKNVKLDSTKKTLWITYKAYMSCGQNSMVLKTLGQMFKHGYEVPLKAFPS